MTNNKTYTLELTADELVGRPGSEEGCLSGIRKLHELAAKARADREENELWLPWCTAVATDGELEMFDSAPDWVRKWTDKQLRLQSAAPELLEAVKAAQAYMTGEGDRTTFIMLTDKALRKVETGTPEWE